MLVRQYLFATGLASRHTLTRSNLAPSRHSSVLAMASSFSTSSTDNPLLADWKSQPYGLPPFKDIKPAHFAPAFEVARREHVAEVKSIADDASPPSFENVALALDRAGALLSRVEATFDNLCASCSSSELQAVEEEMAPVLAAHRSTVAFIPGLFARVDALHSKLDSLSLDEPARRLVERQHMDLVRSGARFDADAQARIGAISERLATLMTKFTQTVTLDESDVFVALEAGDLDGCPADLVAAAKEAAAGRGSSFDTHGSGLVAPLARSFVEPFLTYATQRSARERVFKVWSRRGELDPARDNKPLALETLKLRAEQAKMHGYKNFAEYNVADTMAQRPNAVSDLLTKVWGPAKTAAAKELSGIRKLTAEDPGFPKDADVEPWDWRFYAERVRRQDFSLDEEAIKPHFSLDAVLGAAFDVANKLFGLKFIDVSDKVPAYHPDVRTFEVRGPLGSEEDCLVAIFLFDTYARPVKQSGAWMSEFRTQHYDESGKRVPPIVINNNNFIQRSGPTPTLLSLDDATTLFHEFGHANHGMLSDVPYERLAGTSVLRDFVELPSQLMEHWLLQPEVLNAHAKHWESGKVISEELVDKIRASQLCGKGFGTVEYLSCALTDQAIHLLEADDLESLDLAAYESTTLTELGMPKEIILRHRLPHFQHLFSSSSYAAAYYVYLWAEVLDADAFDAFLQSSGGTFDRETADRLKACIYSTGGSVEPGQTYRNFRGRDPSVIPMLRKKLGLTAEEAEIANTAK